MKLTQKERIEYIRDPKKFVINKNLSMEEIKELEDDIKGSRRAPFLIRTD